MAETLKVKHEVYRATIPFPRLIDEVELDDATANSWVCPAGTRVVLISVDNAVYMRAVSAAVVPTGETTDGTGSLYIPATAVFEVEEGVTYSFIRAAGSGTALVTIGRYSS